MKTIIASLIFSFTFTSNFSQVIWQQSNGPYSGTFIEELAVNSSGHIFACAYAAGIFRSTDNGNSWIQLNQGLPQVNFEGPRSICIAGNGDIYCSCDNLGIYKSTNNGNSWFQTGMNHTIFNSIIEGNNGFIFAGTPTGGGIYRSTNGGVNWTHLENGLPAYLAVSTLSRSPAGIIYAGSSSMDTSLYCTTDNGESWHWVNLIHFSVLSSVVNNNGHVFAAGGYNGVYGVYRSTNGGINWQLKNSGLAQCRYNSFYCSSINELFLSSDSGLYKSTNNAESWVRIGSKETAYSFLKKQTGEYFLSLIRKGVFKSTNNGNSWQETDNGLSSTASTSVSVSGNGIIYTGSMYEGVFRSTNNGNSWVKIWDGNNSSYVSPVFQAPNGYIFAGIDSGLYRSTNNGVNWTRVTGLYNISAYYINSSGYILLGTTGMFNGIYRSTDNGSNWSILFFGYPVNSFAAYSNGNIFSGTGNGIYRSVNNGNNWVKIGNLNEEVFSITIGTNGYMYGGTRHSGLFRSTDLGNNWYSIWSEFDEVIGLTSNQSGNLFAVVSYAGIYRSTNFGLNWTSFNNGLFNPFVFQLALNSSGYLFAATYGAGIYKTINSTIGIQPISTEIPQEYFLSQNYPNPFNPQTKIKFGLPVQSAVKLKIFDVIGREVDVLVNGELKAGEYNVTWNASSLSSGIYFYRIETDKFTETRKMVLIK